MNHPSFKAVTRTGHFAGTAVPEYVCVYTPIQLSTIPWATMTTSTHSTSPICHMCSKQFSDACSILLHSIHPRLGRFRTPHGHDQRLVSVALPNIGKLRIVSLMTFWCLTFSLHYIAPRNLVRRQEGGFSLKPNALPYQGAVGNTSLFLPFFRFRSVSVPKKYSPARLGVSRGGLPFTILSLIPSMSA